MAVCPSCGNQTGEGAIFCDRCGTRLPTPVAVVQPAAPAPAGGSVICPACGAGNVPGEAFCDFCGSPLEAPVPTAPVEVPAPTAEPAPATPAEAEAGAAPPAEAPLTCPACGAKILPGEAFCANCGASLAQPPIPPEPVVEPAPALEAPVVTPAPIEVPAAEVPAPAEAPTPTEVPAPVVEAPAPVEVPAPVIEAPALVVAAPAPVPVVATCPACGAEVEPTDKFCSNCGAVLTVAPAAVAAEPAVVAPAPSLGPRLVVVDSGAEIPLPAKEEIIVGREDPVSGIFPDVDLTPHGGEEGGVSRRHARIVVEGGSYFVEDLNSTNYTFVNKLKLAPKTRQPLQNGDELRCGRVALVLKL